MSITKNSEIVIAIASENNAGSVAVLNQFKDDPIVEVRREALAGTEATLGAFALLGDMLQKVDGMQAESVAFSIPSSIFPRVREAQNALDEDMDPEDVKLKVVKAWIRRDAPELAEAIEEVIDAMASVETPLLFVKNLNAFRYELNGAESYAAGLEDGIVLKFTNSVAKVGDKEVHVLSTRNFNGVAKVNVRGEAFTRKNGVTEVNATVERNDEPDIALENLRLVIETATGALNRVKKAKVSKSA